jgi:pyruvate/2-oxoglutarate dehydrogenase complex dihydrolipoamide acyltransferase (E2) component
VETDKANMDIEALDDGVIGPLYAKPGEMIPAGKVLADLKISAQDGSVSSIG